MGMNARPRTTTKPRAARATASPVDGRDALLAALPEAEFERHVIGLAERLGWRYWKDRATNAPRVCYACHAPTRGPRNTAGLPDLLLVRGSQLIWVELKAQDGATSSEQRQWIAALRAAGQTVFVWRPSDFDEIQRALAR